MVNNRIDWAKIGLKDKLFKQQLGKCAVCGKDMKPGRHEDYPTIEHKQPLGAGGTDTPDNITLTCRGCNEAGEYQRLNQTKLAIRSKSI
jgi:5-methylcytosine-specific restriction endonuclease McrA